MEIKIQVDHPDVQRSIAQLQKVQLEFIETRAKLYKEYQALGQEWQGRSGSSFGRYSSALLEEMDQRINRFNALIGMLQMGEIEFIDTDEKEAEELLAIPKQEQFQPRQMPGRPMNNGDGRVNV